MVEKDRMRAENEFILVLGLHGCMTVNDDDVDVRSQEVSEILPRGGDA